MKLHIISPIDKKTYTIAWLEINTPIGNFVIQPGHIPTMLTLSPHKPLIFRLRTGKQETLLVQQGFVDITRDVATVLLSQEL
jgi:F0F1-type ATP synthase epsilon subunit